MKKELLTYKDPKSPVSEVFRTLRTNIQFMSSNKKSKTILVTSTFPEEGKSWVTSNLAVTFAQAGKKVILIDADMRKGRQYNIFGVLPRPGLSNYLSNMDADNMETSEDINITNYIQESGVENLHILVAGNVPPNPSELLVSHKMRSLLNELKEMCDFVIIDGTPCDLVTDAIILSRYVDSTIIVTAQKETKKDNLQRIVKNIQNVGGRIAGVVVNKVDISSKRYNQSYYYGSISGGESKKRNKHARTREDIFIDIFKSRQEDEELEKKNELNDIKELLEKEEIIQEENIQPEPEQTIEKTIEQENNGHEETVTNQDAQDTIEINEQEIKELEEINNTINNNKKQYDPRNKKHRNKHRNKYNNNNNYNNYQNNNNDFENQNQNRNIETKENNLSDTVERAESAKDMSEDKANEIINLVNNYIEAEKQKQERKY